MAVTVTNDTIKMTADGDTFSGPLVVSTVRFVAGAGQGAADTIRLLDPVSGGELWFTYGGSAIATEAEQISTSRQHPSHWPNGAELSLSNPEEGDIYIRMA